MLMCGIIIEYVKLAWIGGVRMKIDKGDRLVMKKNHPCGSNIMIVLRSGMDFRLRCEGCGHDFMVPRSKAEKNIKQVIHNDNEEP